MKEKENLTFHPNVSNKNMKHREGNIETYLLNYGKMIQGKHEQLRQEYNQSQC